MTAITALAIDPGVTSGLCFARVHEDYIALGVDQGEFSLGAMFALVAGMIQDPDVQPLHIIYEDFTYRNASRMGLNLTPVKLIGIIECFREWHEPMVGFYKQSAATGKTFYTDEKLKGLGIYERGKPHGRDATRHFMQWANFGAGAQFVDLERVPVRLLPKE